MRGFGGKTVVLAGVILVVIGCAGSRVVQYAPEGQEQFVFTEKSRKLQKYGYDHFCKNTKTFACSNRLDYKDHVGKKGYFSSEEPVHVDIGGYEFWPVVLETGEKYFYVSNDKYGGKYGSSAPIISLAEYREVKDYKSESLVPGSTIQVQDAEVSFGKKVYSLSNGQNIGEKKLSHIREIAGFFQKEQARIAESLLGFDISKDDVESRFFIQPKGDILRDEAKLYVGVNSDMQWLRMKIKYYGDNWLFVSSYKVAADEYRWQSPEMTFQRDHSGGDVWEWVDTSPSDQDIQNLRKLAKAEKPIIRFQGDQYYSDFVLDSDQQQAIVEVLELHEVMKGSRK